jgi:hypothetical protein
MRRAHDPSRFRGRGLWLRRQPQQQAGDAGLLRGQCQLAAGDEIELARFAPDFQHHDANRIAGQRVGGRAQRGIHVGGAHAHQQPRIETEFGQPAHRQRARFNLGKILTDPHQWPPCRRPPRKASDEPGRRGALPSFGEDFVHRGYREAALQGRVRIRMSECHPGQRHGVSRRLDALDAAAQTRKRAYACASHAPLLPKSLDRHWFFR